VEGRRFSFLQDIVQRRHSLHNSPFILIVPFNGDNLSMSRNSYVSENMLRLFAHNGENVKVKLFSGW